MDLESSNLAETFKLFKQQMKLYFVVNKIKNRTTSKLHTIESWEWRFKKTQHMVINGGRKTYLLLKLFLISSLNYSNLKKISEKTV